MLLRNGKKYFKVENQPFKMVLLPKKIPKKGNTYNVIIDFDEASKEWRKNKISLGGGVFQYK
jgi:hypothetical protein